MKRLILSLSLLILCCSWVAQAGDGVYMLCPGSTKPNSWIMWRSDVPASAFDNGILKISCDSKYWLWINGELAVFEGCVKRGPNARDSYYDEIDLKPYLKDGVNKIAILQWYFGKGGFSHNDSGRPVMWLNAPADGWKCAVHPAYGDTDDPKPNYRLPESNIRFDARADAEGWQTADLAMMVKPEILEGEPLGKLVKRPIPMWKDYGVKELEWKTIKGALVDTMIADLPYNMQITPIVKIKDCKGGNLVKIQTDHAYHGLTDNIRAEYVTAKGTKEYESLGWMNGEKLLVIAPHGVTLKALKYRETGYDMTFEGSFLCSDPFYNLFWQKALRTLYVNMRDNFFDCPDRERAQWWGDIVTLQGEAFYSCSLSVSQLIRKGIMQICEYQREDGSLFSPIPGTYNQELPAQMLSVVGRYGFWTYYMNTGDREILEFAYPHVKRYLQLWSLDETGLTAFRKGGWSWGDWGKDIDLRLILGAWHYMALDGAAMMADELGLSEDAKEYRSIMEKVKAGYNACWTGKAYRHPDYKDATDDRVQAMAVVAGIAPEEWWPAITETLKIEEHASPYLEKYVMEALFKMGEGKYALERERKRFAEMVDNTEHTTLYEGWRMNDPLFGGGTANHAWSGGSLTVIAQELCGIRPLKPGWKSIEIKPQPAGFENCSISFPTVAGTVSSTWTADKWTITVPVEAVITNPWTGEEKTISPGTTVMSR